MKFPPGHSVRLIQCLNVVIKLTLIFLLDVKRKAAKITSQLMFVLPLGSAMFDKHDEETQYLDTLKTLIYTGRDRNDRTGVGVLSHFGIVHWHFDLRNGSFPLLTTKRMRFDIVAKELLWNISGSTNANKLSEDGIDIWKANSSREFLDKYGFCTYKEGDLGPSYGHQWRFSGSTYKGIGYNYFDQGIDQLERVIDLIKNDPDSRRIILTNWVPQDIAKIPLPPCMIYCQFDVGVNGELSCLANMRSGDMGLGVPYNIASAALLTHLIAHVTELKAHKLILVIGNSHVYSNHVVGLKTQLEREPKQFPKLEILRNVNHIDDFTFNDLSLRNYDSHGPISLKMAK